jgi:hypothetical protein
MPKLNFEVVGVESPTFAAGPMLIFKLRISNADSQQHISSIALRCQIRFRVTHRHYSAQAQARLLDVFGEPQRWGETLHDLLWTHVSTVVPAFSESIVADLPIPCTYDFELVSTKYFAALEDGYIPLIFLFSGTIFYVGTAGNIQIEQIPWTNEAHYQLPVETWKQTIERYYPNVAWIRLRKDIFDELYQYKITHGFPTWEKTFAQLLQTSNKEVHQ